MNRLILGFAWDVTWRSALVLIGALALMVPAGLFLNADGSTVAMIATLFGGLAALLYSARFGQNLSWLLHAPVSRSRLFWYNYALNILPAILAIGYFAIAVAVSRHLPADVTEKRPHEVREHAETFAPLGTHPVPYILVGLIVLHGMVILPRVANYRYDSGTTWRVYGASVLFMVIALFASGFSAMHGLLFIFAMCGVGYASAVTTSRVLALPGKVRRRFHLRYGAVTLLMTAAGLAYIW